MTYPLRRLGNMSTTRTSVVDKKSYDGELPVRLCNYTDVYKNSSILLSMDFMRATASPEQILKFGLSVGDTVFTKDSETADDIGVPAYVAETAADLVYGYHLAIARPDTDITDPRFLYWALSSSEAAQQWQVLASGVTRVGLRQSDIGKLELHSPPLDKQRQIAVFLDRETAQIDDLIGKQERLIGLLSEKRQAVITEAVTKGLDLNAPTKPSGIPWLGKVPIHWSIPKLGMHSRIGNGSTPSRENLAYWVDGTIPWLNSSHVNRDEVTDSDQFITDLAVTECHLPRVAKGNLLVGLTGQGRTRGMASIVRFETTINQHVAYVAASENHWDSEYLLLFLRAAYDQLRELSDENGSTKGALTCAALKNLSVCLPPHAEQSSIVTAVNANLARIDGITLTSKRAIDLLRERRSALISAAVTGKIDVREGVA